MYLCFIFAFIFNCFYILSKKGRENRYFGEDSLRKLGADKCINKRMAKWWIGRTDMKIWSQLCHTSGNKIYSPTSWELGEVEDLQFLLLNLLTFQLTSHMWDFPVLFFVDECEFDRNETK